MRVSNTFFLKQHSRVARFGIAASQSSLLICELNNAGASSLAEWDAKFIHSNLIQKLDAGMHGNSVGDSHASR